MLVPTEKMKMARDNKCCAVDLTEHSKALHSAWYSP